jgi:predicted DsbA family dithiol-disulfide isomerase
MKIEVVSDIACPWCAVGVYSLERALAALGGGIAVELSFEPFELNPDMPPEGKDAVQYLSAKYGIDAAQIRRNQQVIRERGAAVGFDFGERTWIWNTFDAHRLLHWAAREGRQRELKHALLRAYHSDGRNPGSREVLIDLATKCELDAGRAAQIVDGDAYAAEVRADEQQWLRAGIDAVPSVVVNRRYLIQGAQSPAEFEEALRRIAAAE